MAKPVRKTDLRSNSFESFARAREQQPVLRNRRASISSYPERTRSPSICLSDDSWVYSPQQKVEWVDETKVNDCRGCSKPFSMIVRKHHCRNCGDVFCGTCSSFKILLPSYTERQRVCLHCVTHLAADCRLPPRSPDAPGYPSELAVNTSLPDDLDNLFDEIIESEKEEGDFQSHLITKPRRAVSSVSRPPRKLFSSVLPVPPTDDDDATEIEQTTTIKFGTENFNKTVSALATISESQLNANLDMSMDADNRESDEPKRKISFSSLRPPRKSFSQSSPLKQQRTVIVSDEVENIRPNLNDVVVYRADTGDVVAKDSKSTFKETPGMFSPGPKDSFHTLSPIVPHSPEADKANRYCESTVTFSPAAKLVTGDVEKDPPPVTIVQATPIKTTAGPVEVIKHVEATRTTSSELPAKSIGNLKLFVFISCIALLLMGGFIFALTGKSVPTITKVESKTMTQNEFEFTKDVHMERQVEKINLDEYALKRQHTPKKGFNIADFGMYEDIMDISDSSDRSAEDRRPHPSSSRSFVPRSTTASAMTVFKKRTYQMLSDSIQSHTVNSFVNMLRELYRRIKDLNLLKRLDVFIRGVVLSVVNSGQERIPAHI